jgi:MFS family permease
LDYGLAVVVGLVISTFAALILSRVGIFLALILGPLAGGVIAEVVWWVIRRRRGRWMGLVVSICIALGGLLSLILSTFFFSPTSLLALIIYTVLAIGTAYARLR